MTLRRRPWLYPVWVWLSLVIVLGNALAPLGPSLQSRTGSAFSAFTSDVSLGPVRGDEDAKARRAGDDRDRQLRLAGGDVAILPPLLLPAPRAAPDGSPAASVPTAAPAPGAPHSHYARAPPRA